MIDFEPTEEQRLVRDAVADVAKTVLLPKIREVEALRALPDDVSRTLRELGLPLAGLPETLGGQGLTLASMVLIEEELAAGDPTAAYAMPGPGAFGRAVLEIAGDAAQRTWLAAFAEEGSRAEGAVAWSEAAPRRDREGFSTTATREGDGWTIRGTKSYVQRAATADRLLVFASVDDTRGWEGLGAFVVEPSAQVKIGARAGTLGLDGVSWSDVTFDGARAAARLDDGEGLTRGLARFFLREALLVAARAVGLARSAVEVSRAYCDGRIAFGKPIGHFQAIAFKLADRAMDVDGARWMVWRAAWAWEGGDPLVAMRLTAQAAAHALEVAMRAGDDAVQLHGGAGFMRDYPVEKMMRDAKQMALTCPTVTQLDQIAAAIELGVPLAASVVLPTPDLQAIFT